MKKPALIDVFFPVPEGWGICTTCEMMMAQADLGQAPFERGLDEYPQDWQDDFKRLSALIYSLADQFQDGVNIRIWDPRSLQGMWKSIRHGIRRYPTFLLDNRTKITGWEQNKLEEYIRNTEEIADSDI